MRQASPAATIARIHYRPPVGYRYNSFFQSNGTRLRCGHEVRHPGAPDAATLGGDYPEGVARLARLGQLAQDSRSPFGPGSSGPPQDPRRQRPDSIAPIAIAANPIANTTSAAANTGQSD
jgi:hypothetical protein